MEILVRRYVQNSDKVNDKVTTIEQAFKILGKEHKDVESKTDWLNYVDLHFKGTKDYIRIIN